MITEIAPAKVNLYLHVGPLRDDGLHDLKSLFVFADNGDEVSVSPSAQLSLDLKGPFASALAGEPITSNLIWKAAQALQGAFGVKDGAAITLEKRLPIAAGIGGGSADAAAALRALIRLWALDVPQDRLHDIAFALGADVPACLDGHPVNVGGAGEELSEGPDLPGFYLCLVNPRVEAPTGPVFRAFDAQVARPPYPEFFPADALASFDAVERMMRQTRNDLEAPARKLTPKINEVLSFLQATPNCSFERMSGSGATCFGVFEHSRDAQACATAAVDRGWWSQAATVLGTQK